MTTEPISWRDIETEQTDASLIERSRQEPETFAAVFDRHALLARMGADVPRLPGQVRADARARILAWAERDTAVPVRVVGTADERPKRVVRRRRRVMSRFGLAAAAAAAATAAAVALPFVNSTPAYAVDKNADGTVDTCSARSPSRPPEGLGM